MTEARNLSLSPKPKPMCNAVPVDRFGLPYGIHTGCSLDAGHPQDEPHRSGSYAWSPRKDDR